MENIRVSGKILDFHGEKTIFTGENRFTRSFKTKNGIFVGHFQLT